MAKQRQDTPVDRACKAFGTATELAAVMGVGRSAVTQMRDRGGIIPAQHMRAILVAAQERNLELYADDLIP